MGTDPYGEDAPERMTETEKVIGDGMLGHLRERRYGPFDMEGVLPAAKVKLPFSFFVNGNPFANGFISVGYEEMQFHFRNAAELELLIRNGVFDSADINVIFNPATPKDDNDD